MCVCQSCEIRTCALIGERMLSVRCGDIGVMGYGGDGKEPRGYVLEVAWILLHGYCCMDIVATMLLGVTTRYNEGKALIRRRLRGGWGVGVARMDGCK